MAEWLENRATPSIFTVNSTADLGDSLLGDGICDTASNPEAEPPIPPSNICTLRAAIQEANADGFLDTIEFSIATGQQTIRPLSLLPTVSQPVLIDGQTQPGFNVTPIIELDGSAILDVPTPTGLALSGSSSTVTGLVINRFGGAGILLFGSGGHTVHGNYIGTDITGAQDRGNGGVGVLVVSDNNTIGGAVPAARNLISGNGESGIEIIEGNSNVVVGNLVGINILGTQPIGNGFDGVHIDTANNNTVGGADSQLRNLIAGNFANGVGIHNDAFGNKVMGNWIGLSLNGNDPLPNHFSGVRLGESAVNNTIGGVEAGAGNIISSNLEAGVFITGTQTGANVIMGNFIGTDSSGTIDRGNSLSGIIIGNAPNNTIGGTALRSGNLISGNDQHGIEIVGGSATGNLIQRNYLGINVGQTDFVIAGDSPAVAILPNNMDGVFISNAPHNTIGGGSLSSTNTISGNKGSGVEIRGDLATGNVVHGNFIGTNPTGEMDLGNSGDGVRIEESSGNSIGGNAAIVSNVISGNELFGVVIQGNTASGNLVSNNYIGTDNEGNLPLSNRLGISINGAPNNTIGGIASQSGNVIAGNQEIGVLIFGADASGNVVLGNLIGTNATGTSDLQNEAGGVVIENAPENFIGGTVSGSRNVISSNGMGGIKIIGASATNNFLQGNFIGIQLNGLSPLGNIGPGIFIGEGASLNTVGGTEDGAANSIAFNQAEGVVVQFGNRNLITRNRIFSNELMRIDLGGDGRTDNDPLDADLDSNLQQNFPVLTQIRQSPGLTETRWLLESAPNTAYTIEVFAIQSADTNNQGGSSRFLGSTVQLTDDDGTVTFSLNFGVELVSDEFISATAIDPDGNTSEFSPPRAPVLIVPGIGATFPRSSEYPFWLRHRGVRPEDLLIDPLLRVYDDLIQTFRNIGYTDNFDIFSANYDWRLLPGPIEAAQDGTITRSAIDITADQFVFGMDYLGFWLKQAVQSWHARFPSEPLEEVNIISHSTGGLVSRSYFQSDGYGGEFVLSSGETVNLPRVRNFIMLGVPNLGASKAWNPLHDNWNFDSTNRFVFSKIINHAYEKVLEGETIDGTDEDITIVSITNPTTQEPDPILFIEKYVPTIRALLATYPFLRIGDTVVDVNDRPADRNSLLLDLNANGGPQLVLDNILGSILNVIGTGQETPTEVEQKTGPGCCVLPFTDIISNPVLSFSTVFFDDITATNSGDETVPTISAAGLFPTNPKLEEARFTDVTHTGMVSNLDVQSRIMIQLGLTIQGDPFSSNLLNSTATAGLTVLRSFLTVFFDPVEGFLVDAVGRRLGYSSATGVLTEIPGSFYMGNEDGIGWLPNPVDMPFELQLTGLNSDHLVQVVAQLNDKEFGAESSGFLATGQIRVVPILQMADTDAVSDLALAVMVPPSPSRVGAPVTYSFHVQNSGPEPGLSVEFLAVLPTTLTFLSSTPSVLCNSIGSVVTCNMGTVTAGNSSDISLTLIPTEEGDLSFTAQVQAGEIDPNLTNNSTDATANIVDTGPFLVAVDFLTAKKNISKVVIRFSEALDPATAQNPFNFGVFNAGTDKLLGTADDIATAIATITYDPTARTVTLTPLKTIKQGRLIRYSILDSVTDIEGDRLDGEFGGSFPSGDFVAGGNFGIILGLGTKIKYSDSNRDSVALTLKGGGLMRLTMQTNGEVQELQLSNVVPQSSTLTGSVKLGKVAEADGVTTLQRGSGFANVINLLPAQFQFIAPPLPESATANSPLHLALIHNDIVSNLAKAVTQA